MVEMFYHILAALGKTKHRARRDFGEWYTNRSRNNAFSLEVSGWTSRTKYTNDVEVLLNLFKGFCSTWKRPWKQMGPITNFLVATYSVSAVLQRRLATKSP